jgi:HEAT repeat protein
VGLIERLLGPNIDKLVAAHDIKRLVELTKHPKAELRVRAVKALADLDDARVVGVLISTLGDADPEVANAARNALRDAGEQAVSGLEEALGSDDETIGAQALELLLEADPPDVTPFVEVLRNGNDRARAVGAEALISLIPQLEDEESQEASFKAMRVALGDRDPDIRAMVAGGLGRLADDRASKALVAQLKDGTEEVREACADALLNVGSSAIPFLLDALGDRNANARGGAARLLGLLGSRIDGDRRFSVIERLQGVTRDRDAGVADRAAKALSHLGAVAMNDEEGA